MNTGKLLPPGSHSVWLLKFPHKFTIFFSCVRQFQKWKKSGNLIWLWSTPWSAKSVNSPWLLCITQLVECFLNDANTLQTVPGLHFPSQSRARKHRRCRRDESSGVFVLLLKLRICCECSSWAFLVHLYCPLRADAIKHNKCITLLYFLWGFHLCLPLSISM